MLEQVVIGRPKVMVDPSPAFTCGGTFLSFRRHVAGTCGCYLQMQTVNSTSSWSGRTP